MSKDYYTIKTALHIGKCCASFFTVILQTMNYHFKGGQICDFLSAHKKNKKQEDFYLLFYVYVVALKPSTNHCGELSLTLLASIKSGGKFHCAPSKMPHAGQMPQRNFLNSQRLALLLPFPTVPFNTCCQSNSSQNTFCFQLGSLTSFLKSGRVCV